MHPRAELSGDQIGGAIGLALGDEGSEILSNSTKGSGSLFSTFAEMISLTIQ